MAIIRPPSWCADAVPTTRGWTHPKTGELLKAIKIKEYMINEWHANQNVEEVKSVPVEIQPVVEEPWLFVDEEYPIDEGLPEIVVEEAVEMDTELEMLTEAPVNNKSLEEMTKRELEDLGRQHGVELDRRKTKKTLVDRMKNLLG